MVLVSGANIGHLKGVKKSFKIANGKNSRFCEISTLRSENIYATFWRLYMLYLFLFAMHIIEYQSIPLCGCKAVFLTKKIIVVTTVCIN